MTIAASVTLPQSKSAHFPVFAICKTCWPAQSSGLALYSVWSDSLTNGIVVLAHRFTRARPIAWAVVLYPVWASQVSLREAVTKRLVTYNNGMNAEAKQWVSIKVFAALTSLAFVKGSGTFGPGYAGRYVLE